MFYCQRSHRENKWREVETVGDRDFRDARRGVRCKANLPQHVVHCINVAWILIGQEIHPLLAEMRELHHLQDTSSYVTTIHLFPLLEAYMIVPSAYHSGTNESL